MEASVRIIVIFALLTWAVGLFLPAIAQNPNTNSVIDVTGTTWAGTDSDGDYYEYTFQPNGVLDYKSPSGTFIEWHWQEVDDTIYMQTYLRLTTRNIRNEWVNQRHTYGRQSHKHRG